MYVSKLRRYDDIEAHRAKAAAVWANLPKLTLESIQRMDEEEEEEEQQRLRSDAEFIMGQVKLEAEDEGIQSFSMIKASRRGMVTKRKSRRRGKLWR